MNMTDIFINIVSKVLPGVSAMENIHPLFVHFPIALLTSFFVLELLGSLLKKEDLRVAATWLLYLGTMGAMGAVAAGLWAYATVPHGEEVHSVMQRHMHMGLTVLSLGIILSLWRLITSARFSKVGQVSHLLFALIMVNAMTFGADLGGLMVYKYGVGVKAVPQPAAHEHDGMGHHHMGNEEQVEDEDRNVHEDRSHACAND